MNAPVRIPYVVTEFAGELIAGKPRGEIGSTIRLTEAEARYELLLGTIVPEGTPLPPYQPPPAIAATDTLRMLRAGVDREPSVEQLVAYLRDDGLAPDFDGLHTEIAALGGEVEAVAAGVEGVEAARAAAEQIEGRVLDITRRSSVELATALDAFRTKAAEIAQRYAVLQIEDVAGLHTALQQKTNLTQVQTAIAEALGGAGAALQILDQLQQAVDQGSGSLAALVAEVGEKASRDELAALADTVDGKVSQASLQALANKVETKADATALAAAVVDVGATAAAVASLTAGLTTLMSRVDGLGTIDQRIATDEQAVGTGSTGLMTPSKVNKHIVSRGYLSILDFGAKDEPGFDHTPAWQEAMKVHRKVVFHRMKNPYNLFFSAGIAALVCDGGSHLVGQDFPIVQCFFRKNAAGEILDPARFPFTQKIIHWQDAGYILEGFNFVGSHASAAYQFGIGTPEAPYAARGRISRLILDRMCSGFDNCSPDTHLEEIFVREMWGTLCTNRGVGATSMSFKRIFGRNMFGGVYTKVGARGTRGEDIYKWVEVDKFSYEQSHNITGRSKTNGPTWQELALAGFYGGPAVDGTVEAEDCHYRNVNCFGSRDASANLNGAGNTIDEFIFGYSTGTALAMPGDRALASRGRIIAAKTGVSFRKAFGGVATRQSCFGVHVQDCLENGFEQIGSQSQKAWTPDTEYGETDPDYLYVPDPDGLPVTRFYRANVPGGTFYTGSLPPKHESVPLYEVTILPGTPAIFLKPDHGLQDKREVKVQRANGAAPPAPFNVAIATVQRVDADRFRVTAVLYSTNPADALAAAGPIDGTFTVLLDPEGQWDATEQERATTELTEVAIGYGTPATFTKAAHNLPKDRAVKVRRTDGVALPTALTKVVYVRTGTADTFGLSTRFGSTDPADFVAITDLAPGTSNGSITLIVSPLPKGSRWWWQGTLPNEGALTPDDNMLAFCSSVGNGGEDYASRSEGRLIKFGCHDSNGPVSDIQPQVLRSGATVNLKAPVPGAGWTTLTLDGLLPLYDCGLTSGAGDLYEVTPSAMLPVYIPGQVDVGPVVKFRANRANVEGQRVIIAGDNRGPLILRQQDGTAFDLVAGSGKTTVSTAATQRYRVRRGLRPGPTIPGRPPGRDGLYHLPSDRPPHNIPSIFTGPKGFTLRIFTIAWDPVTHVSRWWKWTGTLIRGSTAVGSYRFVGEQLEPGPIPAGTDGWNHRIGYSNVGSPREAGLLVEVYGENGRPLESRSEIRCL